MINSANSDDIIHVTIYKINGEVIISRSNFKNQAILDLSQIPNGIYILKIQTNSGSIIKKVIKNN